MSLPVGFFFVFRFILVDMENEASGASSTPSSGNDCCSAPPSIVPPPRPSSSAVAIIEGNDGEQASGGIDVPSNVRNLKDIMKYSTQMTDVSDNNVIDLTFSEEVLLLFFFFPFTIIIFKCPFSPPFVRRDVYSRTPVSDFQLAVLYFIPGPYNFGL